VSKKEVIQRGGRKLFRFHSSLADALQSCFPEFSWQPSKFRFSRTISPTAALLINNQSKQHKLLSSLNSKFNIQQVCPPTLCSFIRQYKLANPLVKLSEWKMVAKQEVERTKEGRTLTMVHSSFSSALNALHPDIDWNGSSTLTEKQFHLRLLDRIKHKLGITQVLSQCFILFSCSLYLSSSSSPRPRAIPPLARTCAHFYPSLALSFSHSK